MKERQGHEHTIKLRKYLIKERSKKSLICCFWIFAYLIFWILIYWLFYFKNMNMCPVDSQASKQASK